jgi:hypothetical protein
MIQIFYAGLLVVFGALIVAVGTRHLLQVSALREELRLQRTRRDEQELRLTAAKTQLGQIHLDTELLDMEVEALEQRERCMRNLERFDDATDTGATK